MKTNSNHRRREIRHFRIRKTISGTKDCPRISVYKSNTTLYVQIINDVNHSTIISTNSKKLGLKNGANKEAAKKVGEEVGKAMKNQKISKAVFDRGGFLYHGVIKELADAIREQGIKF